VYRSDNEPVTLTRDVDAIIVPAGMNVKLREGQQGFITQALGGSFTVYVEGNLFRIAGQDADALGKEAADVHLGLVYSCDVHTDENGDRVIDVKMTLTAPGCGMGDVLVQDVRDKVEIIPTVKRADVELVFDPPWNQSMMSEAAQLQTGMM